MQDEYSSDVKLFKNPTIPPKAAKEGNENYTELPLPVMNKPLNREAPQQMEPNNVQQMMSQQQMNQQMNQQMMNQQVMNQPMMPNYPMMYNPNLPPQKTDAQKNMYEGFVNNLENYEGTNFRKANLVEIIKTVILLIVLFVIFASPLLKNVVAGLPLITIVDGNYSLISLIIIAIVFSFTFLALKMFIF